MDPRGKKSNLLQVGQSGQKPGLREETGDFYLAEPVVMLPGAGKRVKARLKQPLHFTVSHDGCLCKTQFEGKVLPQVLLLLLLLHLYTTASVLSRV